MKKLILPLIGFLLASCSSLTEKQQELLNKKWFVGKDIYIIFGNDMKTESSFKGNVLHNDFGFEDDNTIIFNPRSTVDTLPEVKGDFEVKDSLLLITIKKEKGKTDSSFYHLNNKYKHWQIRELYYYGKVIHEKDPNPFVYFEF